MTERTARALITRRDAWEKVGVLSIELYSDLAVTAASQGKFDEAFESIRLGRQSDPVARRPANEPHWDMLEIRLKARSERPEDWVPDLAVLLERYQEKGETSTLLISMLIDLGLVKVEPNPDQPDGFLLDTRVLQSVMVRYGPRVTTASGQLGVAANRGGLWTPGSDAGAGGGGLWTPGSGPPAGTNPPPAGGGPSKLILPGR